jgi:glycosyltransferase involved in cell wall biosynthesis
MGSAEADGGQVAGRRRTLLISANAFWNIANFRDGLIREFVGSGIRVVIAAPESDERWAAARGVETTRIAIDRSGLNPIRDARLLFAYHGLIRSVRPNIFLGFTAKPNIYGSIAARWCGVPAVPNVSGLGTAFINPGLLSAIVGFLYRFAFRRCPIVFFQNPDDRDLFVQRRIIRPEQGRLLAGSGVNLGHFSPAPQSSGIRFLFVGRLLGDKGVREFVEAARLLQPEHPDWRFQLLGPLDKENRTAIGKAELDRWVAEAAIEYVGHTEDVRPFVAAATAVVLPSYREGLPRSLLEAAAMARPLIASDVPGNRHIVQHGRNGLLCRARDHIALAEAMEKLATMEGEEREAMGRAGRALVEREFGEEQVIQAYRQALAQLCAAEGS